ncbi:MAG: MXAN_6640 family putative metalloprotease [Myxococcota bacterium]
MTGRAGIGRAGIGGRATSAVICVAVVAGSVAMGAQEASAQPCPTVRPTDPSGGFIHYDDPLNVTFYDPPLGEVRVWYATAGTHAPVLTPVGPSGAPANVEVVGEVMEDAFLRFGDLGFGEPRRDGAYDACASNGGDGRLDVYLVDFASGADGAASVEVCNGSPVQTCSGFMLLDHRYNGYASFRAGVEIVGPHELFHLIQYAYDANIERWWAEGTAQWATKQLYPESKDLEAFLPFFFDEPGRSLDAPPGGATVGWLYATAIWPTFLAETEGPDVVREVLEAMAQSPQTSLEATQEVLARTGGNLPASYLNFAAYNAATGQRASAGGYPDGATYPEVALVEVAAGHGVLVDDRLAGFGASYYLSREPRSVRLEADPARATAVALPFEGDTLDPTTAIPLPADLTGPAVIVVAGQSSSKVDALYQLVSEPISDGSGGAGAGGGGAAPSPPDDDDDEGDPGGCTVAAPGLSHGGPHPSPGAWRWVMLTLLGASMVNRPLRRRRHRRRRSTAPSVRRPEGR